MNRLYISALALAVLAAPAAAGDWGSFLGGAADGLNGNHAYQDSQAQALREAEQAEQRERLDRLEHQMQQQEYWQTVHPIVRSR